MTRASDVGADDARDLRESGPLPPARRRILFGVVSLALLMASVDQTIVATALRTIQHDLHAGIEWSSWTITVYALGQVLIMPLAGRLSDMYGRKRILIIAVALFTGASLLCGLSTSIYMLVPLRAVQSIGGGGLIPSATGIISDAFGRNRDRAIGMFSSIFPIGGVIGPVLGGLFVSSGAWRGIFLINVPIGIALLPLAAVLIPRTTTTRREALDVPGVLLLAGFLLALMVGIAQLGDGAVSVLSWRFFVPELLAVLLLALFLVRITRAQSPFVPPHLLIGRGFGVMNLLNFLFGAAVLGFGALIPLYAQDRFAISPLASGTLLTARAVGMVSVAGLAVLALRRTGYRLPIIVGFALAGIGLAGMALTPSWASAYLWLSIAGAVIGLGQGLSVPAANNATMQLAPDHVAAISGLRGTFRQAGAIMSVSIVTAAVARSSNAGETLAIAIGVLAILLVVVTPLVRLVPDRRGRW